MIPVDSIISLIIASSSLVIALVALIISHKIFIYSSKDFIPEISFSISSDDILEITNKSQKLHKIERVNFIKIRTIGFEDYEANITVEVPFITNSLTVIWDKHEVKKNKMAFGFDYPGPCAYFCPYDKAIVEEINTKVHSIYSIESKKGYALPSLQGLTYVVEFVYTNTFLERKSLIYLYEHCHGIGFDKVKISDTELNNILNKSHIPNFKSVDLLWNYIIKKYSIPFKKQFGD